MAPRRPKTLAASESMLKPVAALVVVGCDLGCLALLRSSFGLAPLLLWLACALLAGAVCLVDSYGLLSPGASIGAMPASLAALAPAALPGALCLPPDSPLKEASVATYFLACALAAFLAHWFGRLRRAYREAPPIADDAVLLVLGGYVTKGVPVPTVQRRLEVAARLWHASPQRLVLLSGGPTHDGSITEAEAMAAWTCERLGVPREALLLERQATSTRENLLLSQDLLDRRGLAARQVAIVSSDYHLYRALGLARELDIEASCAPASVPLTSRLQQWCREVLVISLG